MDDTNRLAPLWKFAEVTPSSPEFAKLTRNDEVTFIPLEDVWPTNTAENFQTVDWETRLTGYTPFRRGDLLLPKVTPTVTHGRTMIADITTNLGVASTEVYTVRARPSTDPRWLAYVLVETEFLGLAGASVQGTGGLKRISTQFVESYPLPNATPDEQRAIADYLDRETAEIDGMRADLDEMERLLMERRESLFVTIAGNKATEVRVAVTSLLITGSTPKGGRLGAKDRPEKGLPWLRPEDLDDEHASKAIKLTPAESETVKALPANTPLFCGIGATVGKAGFANQKCATNQQITALVPQPGFDARYLFRALQAKQHEIRETAPSSTLKIVNNQRLGAQKVPFFPFAEQRRIADEIDRATAEIDSMLSDITKLRDLLAERRAAVISAAVTGQIDIPVSPTHKDEAHA